MTRSFIGVDLAWSPKNASGLAALDAHLRLRASETRTDDDAIVAFIREHAAEHTVVMVDAPLVIPNRTGMRECDRETHRRFGRYEAGCYPANRENMGRYTGGRPRGEALRLRLERELNFQPPCELALARARGRWLFECYPHPAQVVLFGLPRTLKYKKKRQPWPDARAEFARYLAFVRRLPISFSAAAFSARGLRGKPYKDREDRLDALFCAYLAALAAKGRLEMLGRPDAGSIVVPGAGA